MMNMTMNMMKNMMMGGVKIQRRGYTPYGYLIEINNQILEFATELEADEYIKEFKNKNNLFKNHFKK